MKSELIEKQKKERAMLAFCGGFKIKLPDESCVTTLGAIGKINDSMSLAQWQDVIKYTNLIKKIWHKKLKHIKMPMMRKRDIVKHYTIATISKHMSDGLPAKNKNC